MCHVFITEFGILFKMYYDFFPDPQTFISILKTTVGLFCLYIINFINFEKIYSELFQSFEILITGTTTLSNSMKLSHAMWGHPRRTGHGGEVWQNVVHWKREWQTTSVFLPWEPHEQYEKAKWQNTERGTPQVCRCPICYWISVKK